MMSKETSEAISQLKNAFQELRESLRKLQDENDDIRWDLVKLNTPFKFSIGDKVILKDIHVPCYFKGDVVTVLDREKHKGNLDYNPKDGYIYHSYNSYAVSSKHGITWINEKDLSK